MSVERLTVKPGVNTQATKMQGEAQWVESNQIRFKDGYLQKNGGFARLSSEAFVGTCRGIIGWADFDNNKYMAAGSEQRVAVFYGDSFYDITPIADTSNLTAPFTTTDTSSIVQIYDAGYSPTASDWIRIYNPITINGLLLQGLYQVTTGGSTYEIDCGTVATASGSGGTATLFSTTNTSDSITVTLVGHGYTGVGTETYTVKVSTVVGGITIHGDYTVDSVIDADNFTITGASAASSTTTGYENGGDSRIQYLLPTGRETVDAGSVFGVGLYGVGTYGFGSTITSVPPRIWSFGQWGQDIVLSPTAGTIYFWDITLGLDDNPATVISNAPEIISGGIFVSASAQQIVAVGASSASAPDPLLIRWCDSSDFTVWTASATNQAGSYRITSGSRLVGGINTSQQSCIWTDISMYTMQYIGLPYVYGFNEIARGCGLIAQNAAGMLGDDVLWMSYENFFAYSGGSVEPLPCSVWDAVFKNINKDQDSKCLIALNSFYDEASWFYPSLDGTGEIDKYVTYQRGTRLWSMGNLCRTCFMDVSAFGRPMGIDENGILQEHETSTDEDTHAMHSWAQSGWFSLKNGEVFIFMERALADLKSLDGDPTLKLTVYASKYGNEDYSDVVTYGPYNIKASTKYVRIRARGRFMSVKIESTEYGTSWRLGDMRYFIQPDGTNG